MSIKKENLADESMIASEIMEEAAIASIALETQALESIDPIIDEMMQEEAEDFVEDYDEDDPVVNSIPINLTSLAYPIEMFQYPTKPRKIMGTKTELQHPSITSARLKPNSKQWELEIPLEQNVFFDKEGSTEKWPNTNVENQVLNSVSVAESGQYAAFYRDEQLYILPIESVAQFRPLFRHIDEQSLTSNSNNTGPAAGNGPSKTTVVTMSVKSSSEASQSRLGGALLAQKVSEEETFKDLHWVDHTFEQFRDTVITDESRVAVKNPCSKDEYFTKLL